MLHYMLSFTTRGKQNQTTKETRISFARSQLILFQSRKKFALLYCLATMTGLFCLPGVIGALSLPNPNFIAIMQMTLPLPLASLLVTAGTYIMNDLVDADLDRANGKKRPITSGLVSRRQAWIFVALAFGTAVLLTTATLRPVSIIILVLMLTLGITYSMPRIALMKRFIIKTMSIAAFYVLCALLGMTSAYNFDLTIQSPMLVAGVVLTLTMMVFISSTLNDMGDVDGDKAAGRRTIPIVIGKENTVKLAMGLAAGVLVAAWFFYVAALAVGHSNPSTALTTSAIALIIIKTLGRMKDGFHNAELLRSQHKKLFPLQMAIHPSMVVGMLVV